VVQGDKISAIKIIIILQWLIAVSGSLLIWRTGKEILKKSENAPGLALLAAAIWYASPNTYIHTMNALETGLYAVTVIAASAYFILYKGELNYLFFLKAGIIFGVLFWLRNDAVFFILSAAFLFYYFNKAVRGIVYKILFSLIIAGIIAAPWIIYNYVYFGSLMPISGQAEMINSKIGGNIFIFPSAVIEYLFLIIPVPLSLQISIPGFVISVFIIILIVYILKRNSEKLEVPERKAIIFYGLALLMFFIFYGTLFETYYFVSRYLFPFSAFFIILSLTAIYTYIKFLNRNILDFAKVIFFILMIAFSYLRFNESNTHNLYFMYEWVEKNANQDDWIGAFQSGTIGYFHDNTVNLDGKVNPEALYALKENRIYDYIGEKKIDYLVNWQSTSMLIQFEPVKKNYDLIVNDTINNLSVFRRK
jgi:hypothetical protein